MNEISPSGVLASVQACRDIVAKKLQYAQSARVDWLYPPAHGHGSLILLAGHLSNGDGSLLGKLRKFEALATLLGWHSTRGLSGLRAESVMRSYETLKKKKVAFFYQNDDYGKEGLMGAKKTLEGYNTKLVQEVSVEPLDTDISSQVLRLKMANPDIVILWLLPKHAAMTMGAAAKIGFKPIWMTTSTLSDAPMMYDITEGLWEGVIFDCFAELPDSKDPLMIKYKKAHDEFAPKERWGMFFYAGFLFAEPMIEGFKRAGRDLTREKFVDAMETIKNWNGGIGHNITFAPNQRQGQRSVFLGKCVKGKAVKISDWLEVK